MRRLMAMAWAAVLTALAGCATGPLLDNPTLLHPSADCTVENPVYVPGGPQAYGAVFDNVLEVINEYYDVAYANRYDGRIETFPRTSPGFEQPWKPSTPNTYERLLATLQSMRTRAVVLIQPANDGGFFVKVTVYRELEDLPRPTSSTAGAAVFRTDQTVERQFEVIDPTVFQGGWIPKGQDHDFEQRILEKIKRCM